MAYSKMLQPAPVAGTLEDVGKVIASPPVMLGVSSFNAYHGYKRTRSVGWALLYVLLGPLGIPIALAQGFAKPKKAK